MLTALDHYYLAFYYLAFNRRSATLQNFRLGATQKRSSSPCLEYQARSFEAPNQPSCGAKKNGEGEIPSDFSCLLLL